MKTLIQLFKPYPISVKQCYLERAVTIQNELNNGTCSSQIGGKKLVCAKNKIRFKLGEFRLIFNRCQWGYEPELLLQRKNLERYLKRR